MHLEPQGKWIVGMVVDVGESKEGIVLTQEKAQNVSALMLVDQVGPGVTRVKPGDLVLYMKMHHVTLRDGTYFSVAHEEDTGDGRDNIIAIVRDADVSRLTVGGKKLSDVLQQMQAASAA